MHATPKDWESPEWDKSGQICDWRNYISDEVRAIWDTFSEKQKKALARQADEFAANEEWD